MSGAVTRVVDFGDAEGMRACYGVRREVFVEEQGVPVEVEMDAYMDAYDVDAVHLPATGPDGLSAGTVRFVYGAVARRKYGTAVTGAMPYWGGRPS